MGGDWVPTGVMGCGGGPAGVLAAHFGCQQVTGRGSARYGSGGRHLLALVAFFFGLLGDKGSDGLPAPSCARLGGWVEGLAGYWR